VYCSLTLLTQACSQSPSGSTAVDSSPAPKVGLASVELQDMVRKSERPFVLVNFFATWCRPCRTEMPELVALQQDPASEVQVLLVSIDNQDAITSKLPGFLADNGVDFQTYASPDADGSALIGELYPIWNNSIPLSLIYNREGRLLEAISGMTDRSEIELIVNKHKRLGS
jgi:thiol-disulfide isomerase/thioredoxin